MLSSPEVLPLITTTSQAFSEAVGIGIGKRPMPASMRSMLEQNVFIFSGFKTHAELSAVSALLIGDDGKKKPFEQFARDVRAIDENYNLNYLRAEYNFATQSARSAAQWAEYQTDADQFYLQYRTAADERVRESHALLHDTTLPASDPFWQKFFPPNGWNCRCTVVQVRKSKYPLSDSKKAIANGEKATTALNKKGQNKLAIFRFNPGAEQKIFPPKHPYLPKGTSIGCHGCKLKKLDFEKCTLCYNLPTLCNENLQKISKEWISDVFKFVDEKGHFERAIGIVLDTAPREIIEYCENELKMVLESRDLYIRDCSLIHLRRDFKVEKGKAISREDAINIYEQLSKSNIYCDTQDNKNNFVFIYKEGNTCVKHVFDYCHKRINRKEQFGFILTTSGKILPENELSEHYVEIRIVRKVNKKRNKSRRGFEPSI